MAGGEYGIRGYILALDTKTGKEAWRFYTIPGPGEPGHETWKGDSWKTGGASVWVTGSYDPDTNLTFWGIGNPGPDWNGDNRAGDNLYSHARWWRSMPTPASSSGITSFRRTTSSITTAAQVPVLADIDWQGRPRKVMMWANRNGLFYVLDRTTGQFLMRQALRQGELDERVRRTRPADEGAQRRVEQRRHADLSGQSGRHQLVQPVVQPAHRTVLHSCRGTTTRRCTSSRIRISWKAGRSAAEVRVHTGPATKSGVQNFRADDDIYGAIRAIDPEDRR